MSDIPSRFITISAPAELLAAQSTAPVAVEQRVIRIDSIDGDIVTIEQLSEIISTGRHPNIYLDCDAAKNNPTGYPIHVFDWIQLGTGPQEGSYSYRYVARAECTPLPSGLTFTDAFSILYSRPITRQFAYAPMHYSPEGVLVRVGELIIRGF